MVAPQSTPAAESGMAAIWSNGRRPSAVPHPPTATHEPPQKPIYSSPPCARAQARPFLTPFERPNCQISSPLHNFDNRHHCWPTPLTRAWGHGSAARAVPHNRSHRTPTRLRHPTRCRGASLGTLGPVPARQWTRCQREIFPPNANTEALGACGTRLWQLGPPDGPLDGHPPNWPPVGPCQCLHAVARACPRFPSTTVTATTAAQSPRAIPPSCCHRAAPAAHPARFPLAAECARATGGSSVMGLSRPPTPALRPIPAARAAASARPYPHA